MGVVVVCCGLPVDDYEEILDLVTHSQVQVLGTQVHWDLGPC